MTMSGTPVCQSAVPSQWSDFASDEEEDTDLLFEEDDADECDDDCLCGEDPGIPMGRAPLDPAFAHEVSIVMFDGDEETLPAVAVYVDGELQNWSFKDSDEKDYDGEEYADGLMDGMSAGGIQFTLTRYRYHVPMVEEDNPEQLLANFDHDELDLVPEDK